MKRQIKIIGDSIAAGQGASDFRETDQVLMEYDTVRYFRCEAPSSWWGLLEAAGYSVKNCGCCGAYSYQMREQLEHFVEPEDEVVLVLLGLNDRKRPGGMAELEENMTYIVEKIRDLGKCPIILTPLPSTYENEHKESRICHTDQVVEVLRKVADRTKADCIDNYGFITKYLQDNSLVIEDIILGPGCENDGLHPADRAQKLIFEHVKNSRRLL